MAGALEPRGAESDRDPSREGKGDRALLPWRLAHPGRHLPRRPGDRRHCVLQVRRLGRAHRDAHPRRMHEARRFQPLPPDEAARSAGPLTEAKGMKNVEIVDRSSLLAGLYGELKLDPRETAIVTIDMHRGHLDMEVATMPAKPEDAKRVIANAKEILDSARKSNIPVIHVVLVYRRLPGIGSEGMISHFWKALHAAQGETDRLTPGRRSTVREHNVEGSPGTQIIPELYREGDYVIDNKKRLDCFYGTDLRQ